MRVVVSEDQAQKIADSVDGRLRAHALENGIKNPDGIFKNYGWKIVYGDQEVISFHGEDYCAEFLRAAMEEEMGVSLSLEKYYYFSYIYRNYSSEGGSMCGCSSSSSSI